MGKIQVEVAGVDPHVFLVKSLVVVEITVVLITAAFIHDSNNNININNIIMNCSYITE